MRRIVTENMLPWRDMPAVLLGHAAYAHPWLAKGPHGNFVEKPNADNPLDDAVNRKFWRDHINEALKELPSREADIIRMCYGIGKRNCPYTLKYVHTLEYVSSQFDVTRERIRQIEAKFLRKMRHPRREKKLRPIIDE